MLSLAPKTAKEQLQETSVVYFYDRLGEPKGTIGLLFI